MATSLRVGSACLRDLLRLDGRIIKQQIRQRWKWRHRGRRPEEAKTYVERVAELTKNSPKMINIGFKLPKNKGLELTENKYEVSVKESDESDRMRVDSEEEQLNLRSILNDLWYSYSWSQDQRAVAEHYGLYRDLFHSAYFYPQFPLNIFYEYDSETDTAVYNGNMISPSEVDKKPDVEYNYSPNKMYTLVLTAPDSHLQENKAEYLHWLVGNIPEDNLDKGEELCCYLPPFPVRGTGYHRYVFVLYEQEKKIDFSQVKRPENCVSLEHRTFRMADFYKQHQDDITPVALAFFQSEWDESVTRTFWDKLEMEEPSFEFMHPPPYHPKQVKFPQGQPFNLYLDRYRDVKDLNEEVLKEKLKTASPLSPPPPRPKYPNLVVEGYLPKWLRLKNRHKRLREMHWADLD
ncbi:large ribosomal subunit protein mL38-like [Ylistrum balloti]|uniref:large ribosomal subunit protein mL38-like n=1 Tax=Ylistrum balloti TaxID=509963 RepID=UPI002905E0BA|nr:large ribosomal subunit protein mL38-like [Ylistrum balloti]